MAQESCNLDKDEAEILKPSSSSTSPPQPPTAAPSPSSLFPTKSASQEYPFVRPEWPEIGAAAAAADSSIPVSSSRNPEATSRSQPETGVLPTSSNSATALGCKRKKDEEIPPPARPINRCSCCQKKVGLTGFHCRCGDLFCARHRYSDAHNCSFDYKAAGREEISKANPVVRAAKIIKI